MASRKLFLTMKDMRIANLKRSRKIPVGQNELTMYLDALQRAPDQEASKIPNWFEDTLENTMEEAKV